MSTFSRTATLFSTVVLGSMLATTTVSSVNTVINAAETTQAATTKKNYDLKILQGNSDATSTASQFYLNTISLEKLADGNYYAYLTSNTPVSLGDDPISSEDTQHQVVKMGTTQKNGYNQTVYRLTLTADELASGQPIKTKIHVNIPMMNYDHEYDIRLAIQGFKPETTTSSNNDQTSVSSPTSSVSSTKNSQSTSVSSSSTTSVSDNDTTVSTVNNSQTDESKTTDNNDSNQVSAGEAIKMTADQGMDKFFNSTAHINVKGDKTDVTISLLDDKTVGMIPYITLDGQKKSVTSQDTTFTIPTKDLQADKNGQVTLKSTTHVDAMGHVHDYPSNLTFNVGDLTATQDTFKTGDYQINVSPDSQMDKFFAPKFNVKIGDQTSVVSVTYGVPDIMSMVPSVTFDGQTKDTDGKTSVDFTIPTKDLIPDKDGKVTIASFTSVPMSPSKGYSSNITFDMTPALINAPSDNDSSSSSSSESTATSDKDILQDGTYSINYNVYKSGTTDDSTMKTYMTESAKVNVKDGEATIDFATKNDAMSMMKKFSINGVTAKAKDDSWVVTLPVKDLNKTLTAEMTIYVAAINFTETPSADIVFDMKSVKNVATDDSSSSSVASSSQSNQSSSSAASTSQSSQSSSSATSTSKPSQISSSATSTSQPSQSSSSAASTSKPSQSSSSATSTSQSSQSSSSAASESKPTPAQPDIQKDGKYAINYNVYKSGTTTDSAMANYMTKSAKVTVKNGEATINFETKNDAMSMMKEFSVNGAKAQMKDNSWIVTLPTKDLTKTMKANMTVYVSQIGFTEKPSADIVFDMKSIKNIGSDTTDSSSSNDASSSSAASKSQSSQSSSSAASESKPTPAQHDVQRDGKLTTALHDGVYNNVRYHVYKTGTSTVSTMNQYMTDLAKVTIKNGQATIYFATKNGAMSLMKQFSVNGRTAHSSANGWTVTIPASDLTKTMNAQMKIYVAQLNFTENPSADIVFDLAKDAGNYHPTGNTQQTTAPSSLALPTGQQSAMQDTVLHQLTILQSNSNSTSVAAQYFLPTIQLRHNKNGSYTGYVTTHTPVMMGRNPISFMDSRHQVKQISTIKTGNYYQSTYELQFSENEIKAPIATQIHVQFTSPLQYDHIYTIRLVIGRALSSASEATQPTTGLPDDSGLTTSPLSSDVSRGTSFTPLNNATTTSKGNTQNNAKAKSHTNSHAKKNSHATQVTKDTQDDSKNDNTTQRNVLIVAGGILAAALGYVGVALLTNFFKMR